MALNVCILGCGSATPSVHHLPSCQTIEHNGKIMMVDCGEGAQLSLQRAGISISRLRHIFISHLHGDHILGLPGLLSSLTLHGFTGEIHVYMHALGIDVIKRALEVFAHEPSYTLVFHPIPAGKSILFEDEHLQVEAFPLSHGVPASGFIFREKPKPLRLKADMAEFYNIPLSQRAAIKAGEDFVTADGRVIENKWLTEPAPHSASYAYASDTAYARKVVEAVAGVDCLYHEATYGDDRADKARERGHSTARQAGTAAREAAAGMLVLGHFSKSYNGKEEALLHQAAEEYAGEIILAKEGLRFEVK